MWMCFAFNLEDNAARLFWIKILQEMFAFIFELFWKNSSYVSGVSLCIFVTLWLCMFGCLLQEPIRLKVLWIGRLGTNEILASIKRGIVKGQTRALCDCHIDSSQFFRLSLRMQVFRSIALRWPNTVLRAVSGNSSDGACFKLNKQTWRRKKQWYTDDNFSKSTH